MTRTACCIFFFFFQAEDGIRDYKVTGVQTCALPIWARSRARARARASPAGRSPGARPDGGASAHSRASGAGHRAPADVAHAAIAPHELRRAPGRRTVTAAGRSDQDRVPLAEDGPTTVVVISGSTSSVAPSKGAVSGWPPAPRPARSTRRPVAGG